MRDAQQGRRCAPRVRYGDTAIIVAAETRGQLPCIVEDISETGAKIQAKSINHVPCTFCLNIDALGYSAECIVVWRSKSKLGVIFEAAPELGILNH